MTNDHNKIMVLYKSKQVLGILTYLKEHQDEKPGVSKQKVSDYLKEKQLSSRVTTLNIIDRLVEEGILIDNKTPNYQSNLRINENYDFFQLLNTLLYRQYSELCERLEPLAQFTKNKKLKMNFKKEKEKILKSV
jgi:hypothetical protein